jgi:predicted transposase/invertase (TIGR01784 family)
MKRDSIFYALFQRSPSLLFDLLDAPPVNAAGYRFDSVAVKEPKFEIDGVFLPPEGAPGVVYFCEVQLQKDERLYERVFAESFLYFYRHRERFSNWQIVVIYPSRSIEQSDLAPYQILLDSNQVHRVYLDELGEIDDLPLGLGVMALTMVDEASAPIVARSLLNRANQELPNASRGIIEMLTTILVYKFTNLSRREAEAMIGITLQETRFYREAKDDGREEEARSMVLRQLGRRCGTLSKEIADRIVGLSQLSDLEALGDALLDFESIVDLEVWLDRLSSEADNSRI